jgi:hypothetical protein
MDLCDERERFLCNEFQQFTSSISGISIKKRVKDNKMLICALIILSIKMNIKIFYEIIKIF